MYVNPCLIAAGIVRAIHYYNVLPYVVAGEPELVGLAVKYDIRYAYDHCVLWMRN